MQLSKTSLLGLFVLYSIVCTVSTKDLELQALTTGLNTTANITTEEEVVANTALPTRVPDHTTSIPPLHRSSTSESVPVPEEHEPISTERKSPEKSASEKPKENENSMATSYSQVYPLAIASLAVLLLSAI
ncbi:hypothetical protein HHI36_001239 [Cryptolaemus montrouzieri]|uniref:Uncharacterized protein n=1 Tax=Cryptolaemus montrouzieri TaxID=559131 RepID=A0ABD2P7P6_9CUCU